MEFKIKQIKAKEQEFDWDKYYNRYSNAKANEKAREQKEKVKSQTSTQKQKIVVEEETFDFSKIILYVIAVLVGALVFVVSDNPMWGITSALIVASGVLLSSMFQTNQQVTS